MQRPPGYVDDDTMPLPRIHAAAPSAAEPEPLHAHAPAPSPVFVDSSGRRQRRVRRMGWLLVVPAAGYVVLLISSLFGGPTVESPFLPSPRTPDAAPSRPPAVEEGPAASRSPISSAPPASAAPQPSPSSPGPRATTTGGPGPATTGTGTGTTQAAGSNGRGKPTAPPGQGGKPTAHP